MRRRRQKWLRRISKVIATVAIGAMLGFLVPTIAAEYTPQADVQAPIPEAPIAHRFIEAFVNDDQDALTAMGMSADVKVRASRFRAEYVRVDDPIHLGSYVGVRGISWHAYGVHVVRADGTEVLLGWRVISTGGQAGLITPPAPIEAE